MISIDVASYCEVKPAVDYMVVIIAIEVILLVIVLSKLAYDIWIYRRTGEMPWLAKHICISYVSMKDGAGNAGGRGSSRDSNNGAGSTDDEVGGNGVCCLNLCSGSNEPISQRQYSNPYLRDRGIPTSNNILV